MRAARREVAVGILAWRQAVDLPGAKGALASWLVIRRASRYLGAARWFMQRSIHGLVSFLLVGGSLSGLACENNVTADTSDSDGGTGPTDTGDGGTTDGGTTVDPLIPLAGELVITELMIDSVDVDDESGEWVEIYNLADRELSLTGLILGDDGVDAWVLEGEIRVAAGDTIVLCADTSTKTNGGVPCDGAFFPNTWGDGFAMANAGDEVALRSADNVTLDWMSYVEGQFQPGESLSLGSASLDPQANDQQSAWCAQATPTPGSANPAC